MSARESLDDFLAYLKNDASEEEVTSAFILNEYREQNNRLLLTVLKFPQNFEWDVRYFILSECHFTQEIYETILAKNKAGLGILDLSYIENNPKVSDELLDSIMMNENVLPYIKERFMAIGKVTFNTFKTYLESNVYDNALLCCHSKNFLTAEVAASILKRYETNEEETMKLLEGLMFNTHSPISVLFHEAMKTHEFSSQYVDDTAPEEEPPENIFTIIEDIHYLLIEERVDEFKVLLKSIYGMDFTGFTEQWVERFLGWNIDEEDS